MFSIINTLINVRKTINQYLTPIQESLLRVSQVLKMRNDDFNFW